MSRPIPHIGRTFRLRTFRSALKAVPSLQALSRRFDLLAVEQLRAEVVRLSSENEQLRDQIYWAEQSADSWREDATAMHLQLCEVTGGRPGITQDGNIVVVDAGQCA